MSLTISRSEWEEKIRGSEICRPAQPVHIRIPWCLYMLEAKQLCEKYRAKLTIINSSKLQRALFSMMDPRLTATECTKGNRLWTGFSDESSEGQYIDVNEMRPLTASVGFDPFVPLEPNGKTKENCAAAKRNVQFDVSWIDYDCNRPNVSAFCTIDEMTLIKVKGEETIVYSLWQM